MGAKLFYSNDGWSTIALMAGVSMISYILFCGPFRGPILPCPIQTNTIDLQESLGMCDAQHQMGRQTRHTYPTIKQCTITLCSFSFCRFTATRQNETHPERGAHPWFMDISQHAHCRKTKQ